MSVPTDEGVLEVEGMYFCLFEDDVWLWEEKGQVWTALPELPPYLCIVQGRLALIDLATGRPKCNCPHLRLMNLGCKCGGV